MEKQEQDDKIIKEETEKPSKSEIDLEEEFKGMPIVDSKKELNYISIKAKDQEGQDVEVVLEVEIEDGKITSIQDVGEIKDGKFIATDYFKSEIFEKLSEKSNITTGIRQEVLEREFVPTTPEKLNEMTEERRNRCW